MSDAVCTCTRRCKTQKEMTKRHGTPAEFRRAVFGALDMVSVDEAKTAADKYEREWCAAGRREAIAAEEDRGDGRAR